MSIRERLVPDTSDVSGSCQVTLQTVQPDFKAFFTGSCLFGTPAVVPRLAPASQPFFTGPARVARRVCSVPPMGIERRPLGQTGEYVAVLGFGAMELRGRPRGPAITDFEAGRLLNAVLDGGIDLIDTSPDYGNSEELIGRHVGHRRSEFFLASKCGCSLELSPDAIPPYPHDYSAFNIRSGLEQSLRRLRTDHLDLLQVHMSPSRAQLEADGVLETLQSCRDEGKVRFIGISAILPHLPDHIAMGVFDVFQIPYSVLQREHEGLITAAADAGTGTVIRGGVARGAPAEDKDWGVAPSELGDGRGQRLWESSGLEELLGGMARMEFALRFTLSHPGLSSAIIGTSSVPHLTWNIAVAERGPLPAELYEEAKRRPGYVSP